MTTGLCFCFTAFDQAIEDFWKVDLWVLDSLALQENQLFMNTLKEKMTPEHHALIMLFKNEWTSLYGRPPKMASYYLYQAIILENLKTKEEIIEFFRNSRLKLPIVNPSNKIKS